MSALIQTASDTIASINPETISRIGSVASTVLKIFGGISGERAATTEAGAQFDQARLAQSEAAAEARRIANQNRKFLKRQKLAFIKAGVTLDGSPLFVLETTLKEGQEEVAAEIRRGRARARLFTARSEQTARVGRSALLGPLLEGAASIFNAFFVPRS